MVESFGAFAAITLTMLLASIHGPSGDRPRSIGDAKAFATLASVPAYPAERHCAAEHLLDHESGARGQVRLMRHDDDSHIFAHAKLSKTSATALTINAVDRAPRSM